MQLVSVQVRRYRSVENSGEAAIDPAVTCLVGKNESGKTAFLRALYRVSPAERGAVFDEVIDYPSRLTGERKNMSAGAEVVNVGFSLTAEEVAALEGELGVGVLMSRTVSVSREYRADDVFFALQLDEAKAVAHLRSGLDVDESVGTSVATATTVRALIGALAALPDAPPAATALLQRLTSWREQSLKFHLVDTYLARWLPRFVYFDDYDVMPGKASVPDLIRRRDSGQLVRGEKALLALLTLGGAELEDFGNGQDHERLIRETENAANGISDEVFGFWSQSQQLSVKITVLPPEASAVPPLHEGPILQLRVDNRRHRVSVPFDDRSRGFVWFFSFLAYFSDLEKTEGLDRDLVLLLDEPGLSLHATAQRDLLRLIEDRVASRHQVLYSTHSPFLVDAQHLERVRTVIDEDGRGTVVSADVLRADAETGFPLQAALGYDLAQTLFVGPNNLLLEGPSDLIYLDVLDSALAAAGRPTLDPRWVKIPVGGAGKLSTFVSLLGANRLTVAVVMDASTSDAAAVKRLESTGRLASGGIITIGQVVGRGNADVEDLLPTELYLDLVNTAYASVLPAPITPANLTSTDDRIVRRVEHYFQNKGLGKLNHYKPAEVLLRQQSTLLAEIDKDALDRTQALVERLNALIA